MSFTLYKLAAKNLHLATIFLQLVAKNLRIFFNVPPCRHYQVTPSLTVVQDIEVLGPSSVFCNGGGGGHYCEFRRHEPCRGVWGYPPSENFQIWRLRNVIISTCHEIWLQKIDLEYENGRRLQVTI